MEIAQQEITDCGDEGCGECDVCGYLAFLENARSVAPAGSIIERDNEIEAYIRRTYPHVGGAK